MTERNPKPVEGAPFDAEAFWQELHTEWRRGEQLRDVMIRGLAKAFEQGAALSATPAPGDFDVDGHNLPNLVKKWEGMERMYATAVSLQMSRANEEAINRYRAKAEVCRDFLKDLAALAAAPARDGVRPTKVEELREGLQYASDWHASQSAQADAMDYVESSKWHDEQERLIKNAIGALGAAKEQADVANNR